MSEHTPTPWSVREVRGAGLQIVIDPAGVEICKNGSKGPQDHARANAAFIVKAVNLHDEFVTLVRFLACVDFDYPKERDEQLVANAVEHAKALLAKAESAA